ncbi:DUF4265 domain-containing protein [Marinimicrobium sp. ARAG 43.8]|uniref:DUF4265 domain-containing protein n=1 Tax=Marinimicrobium sp. ARAG 43.8 TaxID=3418719 RepID=UPI003CE6B3B2
MKKALRTVELFAGTRPDGQPIVEQLPVRELDSGELQLVRSPAFAQGLASGDRIRLHPDTRDLELVQRSGNLSIRVFTKGEMTPLADALVPALEKLGGELDLHNDRMLVFTIHASCGFDTIENIMNQTLGQNPDSAWTYGNVYDPRDGTTPLNWWQDLLKPE